MPPVQIVQYIEQFLAKNVQVPVSTPSFAPVGGGSINACYKIIPGKGKGNSLFVKINAANAFPGLFEKEKKGLDFLAAQGAIHVPATLDLGEIDNYQFLLMEWIEAGPRTRNFWTCFGEQLARLHQQQHRQFGFDEDNYMGSLPQSNTWSDNWNDFFIQRRLQPQVRSAFDQGLLSANNTRQFEILYKKLDALFNIENASLLHGDLWSGNFICDSREQPVLIDPAVYFGHRSMDLAMTRLFGGFDPLFYESYHDHFPLPDNYREQWDVCNLYPLLIHLNLFGAGYRNDIEIILKNFAG